MIYNQENVFKVPYKVYTLKSNLIIRPRSFNRIIVEFKKRFPDNDKIQRADKLPAILNICGWSPRIHLTDRHIKGLVYRSNEWPEAHENSLPEGAISVLRHFIEPGGTIYMVDENKYHYWVYRFTNQSMKRDRLDKRFIDFNSEKELIALFKESSKQLIKTGFKRKILKELIDDILIEKLIR